MKLYNFGQENGLHSVFTYTLSWNDLFLEGNNKLRLVTNLKNIVRGIRVSKLRLKITRSQFAKQFARLTVYTLRKQQFAYRNSSLLTETAVCLQKQQFAYRSSISTLKCKLFRHS